MNPNDDILRLRGQLIELQKLGAMTPTSFGLYEQTLLQIYNEAMRRKSSCEQQAATLRQQAAAAEAQSHAYSTFGSIISAVVNGYLDIEKKRIQDEYDRKEAAISDAGTVSASGEVYSTSAILDIGIEGTHTNEEDSKKTRKKKQPG